MTIALAYLAAILTHPPALVAGLLTALIIVCLVPRGAWK